MQNIYTKILNVWYDDDIVLKLCSEYPNDIYLQGLIYQKKHQYDLALLCYNETIKYDPIALHNIGFLYHKGLGLKKDYKQAKFYYEKSIEQKIWRSLNNLGVMYHMGHGVNRDYKIAKKYYEQAIKHNICSSYNNLGNIYRDGLGIDIDYKLAEYYYQQAIKYDKKTDAFYSLARMYHYGIGVEQNILEAIKLWLCYKKFKPSSEYFDNKYTQEIEMFKQNQQIIEQNNNLRNEIAEIQQLIK
jgi:TPR repeat protein